MFEKILEGKRDSIMFFDLTQKNRRLQNINIRDPVEFKKYLWKVLEKNHCDLGIGKYNENRTIYTTGLFKDRSIHLGLDLWTEAGTKIISPWKGKIHSFQDNVRDGDYGPTIIMEVDIMDKFFVLFGHLSKDSLKDLSIGTEIDIGDTIGFVGENYENGSWPPHLHLQIILDMQERKGDYPGVCSEEDRKVMLQNSPDPLQYLFLAKV